MLILCAGACGNLTREQRWGVGAVGTTVYLANSPSTNIEQVYYLGAFDPQDQLPPSVYRVRVRGQASSINQTRFASDWVPADLIDSLGSRVSMDKESGRVKIEKADDDVSRLAPGRKLVMFGPEGFREAPKNHRLVVAMGSSPEKFFQAIDETLGVVASVTQSQTSPELERNLFSDLIQLKSERERIEDIKNNLPEAPDN